MDLTMNKNTEVVGVSDALKQLATKKSPSPVAAANLSTSSLPTTASTTIGDAGDGAPEILDHKISINPSSSLGDDDSTTMDDAAAPSCGWWRFRPKYIQHLMSPKYALMFLCLAGAIQGNWPFRCNHAMQFEGELEKKERVYVWFDLWDMTAAHSTEFEWFTHFSYC